MITLKMLDGMELLHKECDDSCPGLELDGKDVIATIRDLYSQVDALRAENENLKKELAHTVDMDCQKHVALMAENERLKAQCLSWSNEAKKQAEKRDENFIRAEDFSRRLAVAKNYLSDISEGIDLGICNLRAKAALRQINEEPK